MGQGQRLLDGLLISHSDMKQSSKQSHHNQRTAVMHTQVRQSPHVCRYYNGGMMLDEVAVDAVVPPPRPSTVPQALQQTMPLADVLNLIAKPPGSAPPFIPYKPVSGFHSRSNFPKGRDLSQPNRITDAPKEAYIVL